MVKPFAAAVLAAVLLCGPASAGETTWRQGDPIVFNFACETPAPLTAALEPLLAGDVEAAKVILAESGQCFRPVDAMGKVTHAPARLLGRVGESVCAAGGECLSVWAAADPRRRAPIFLWLPDNDGPHEESAEVPA